MPASASNSVALVIDKAFTDASVNAGTSAHTFTISVTNTGPSDAVGVHLTDAVPTALTVTGVSRNPHSFPTRRSSDLDCTFDLANGITKVITVTYSVASSVSPGPVS